MVYEIKFTEDLLLLTDSIENQSYEYPVVWLRDNCLCTDCFHQQTHVRILDVDNFDYNVKINSARFENEILEVKWSLDDHVSSYPLKWLLERNFSEKNIENYINDFYQPKKLPWGKISYPDILQCFEYQSILDDDAKCLEWLEALAKYGVAILKNTPSNENEVYNVANRVAFIRKTHFGDHFVVKAKEDTSTFAYTSATLQLHTDIPFYHHMPSINLLHYLVQSKSKGGVNLIVDAFYVAERIRREFPDYFDTLTRVLVNWTDVGNDGGSPYHYVLRAPVICLDGDGNVQRINRSVTQRDSFFSQSIKNVQRWYKAIKKFDELLKEEAVEFKLVESDFLTFDNTRLVHGRTGYTDTTNNSRTLIGAYLDWDHVYSKIRVLKQKADKK